MTDARVGGVVVEAAVQGTSDMRVGGVFAEAAVSREPRSGVAGVMLEVATDNPVIPLPVRGWGIVR